MAGERIRVPRLRLLALLVAMAAIGLAAVAVSSSSLRRVTSRNGLRLIGPLPGDQRIVFSLELRLRNPARLRTALAAVEDPGSPSFRHFISPSRFGGQFGIPAARLATLEHVIHSRRLRVLAVYPQRTEMSVEGSVRTVDRLLGTRLVEYAGRGGHRYHAPAGAPAIPGAFAGAVDAVVGLDTRPHWHPHDVPIGGLTPAVTAAAYDIAPLHREGLYGQGQTIAVMSFSSFDPRDPAEFARQYGLSGPEPQVVPVDGGTYDLSGQNEANLDIDIIRSIAPAARIVFYESYSSYSAMINRVIANHQAEVISSSWGQCELELDPAERIADSHALSAAAAAGISMFTSTGDNGAYDCQGSDPTDHHLSVDWPAASANAVAVGGTRLYLAPDRSYLGEAAWEDQLSALGGGGGFTTGDVRPPWQAGPGVLSGLSTGHRQLPDVSADADPGTPWSYYSGGQLYSNGAGTSAAAPFWAAAMLLIEQYAERHGVRRVGYVNPILYALASSRQPYPPFHDVTRGGNRYYSAGPGWDPATGLGSPDVYNLARDVVAYVQTHGATGRRR
jgi:kumamolisin